MWLDTNELKPKDQTIPYRLYSSLTLARYTYNITNRTDMTKVVITGSQGTGKTNLAVTISLYLTDMVRQQGQESASIYARGENILYILSKPKVLADFVHKQEQERGIRFDYIIFIFDDFSYVLNHQEIKAMGLNKFELLQTFVKLRHLFPNRRLVILTTIHYKTAILPVLRDAQISVYTTINAEQLNHFKNQPIERYVKAYLHYINSYYIEAKACRLPVIIDDTLAIKDGRLAIAIKQTMKEEKDSDEEEEDEEKEVGRGYVRVSIGDKHERLALADFGTKHSFIYYNIMLQNGVFDVSSYRDFYVIGNSNEGFKLASEENNIIKPTEEFAIAEHNEDGLTQAIMKMIKEKEKIDEYTLYDNLIKQGYELSYEEMRKIIDKLLIAGFVYALSITNDGRMARILCILR
jgi:hypothetical protein